MNSHPNDFQRHLELAHLVDSDGEIPKEKVHLVEVNEAIAIKVVKSMLGMQLEVRGNRFLLTNLELYYGGLGDPAHDWYKANYPGKYGRTKVNKKQTEAQFLCGPRLYINQPGSAKYKYKRMDIVLGKADVAVSVLVRNAVDDKFKLLGKIDGQTKIVIDRMEILDLDHGKDLTNSDVRLFERDAGLVILDSQIETQLRYQEGKFKGFPQYGDSRRWNFSISKIFK